MSHLVMIHFLNMVIWAGHLFSNGGGGTVPSGSAQEFEWQQQLRDWQEQLRDHD